ncbi:ThiF family adenylyltransferase [Paenibacillus beijingensis]|uniref:THIF-type NAD/FAD binding fold domain-containing protein n=1 Tax=Paenibacillus beijingensis TaxID=1126833 RepID=A0A0D5NEP8_9BACL|nr:ThiF family adenylyltransferase [Paenibacillus beijingensis]AJY73610.1 hypothetical protein VN24_01930 [Paenibacillus beijingensis]
MRGSNETGPHAAGSGSWRERYSRQIRFAPLGERGQRQLGEARVLIAGCGALGASLAQHMVRSGVGEVRLADRDYVEPSNLQRQTLFDEEDARLMLPKAVAAAQRLARINSGVKIVPHVADLNRHTLPAIAEGVDLVLDGTDNAPTRLLLSDYCFRNGIPFLYGGVTGASGMTASLLPGSTACLRCLIGDEEGGADAETCDTAGVISPAVEFVASQQAAEALKWLGSDAGLRRTWLSADLWNFRIRESQLPPGRHSCPFCGESSAARIDGPRQIKSDRSDVNQPKNEFDGASGAAENPSIGGEADSEFEPSTLLEAVTLCGRDTVQVKLGTSFHLPELHNVLERRGFAVTKNPYLLRAEFPDPDENGNAEKMVIFPDGRILVHGTSDAERARQLCNLLSL